MSHYLPRITAESDVDPKYVVWAHEALRQMPEAVADMLWGEGLADVALRNGWSWEGENSHGEPWKDCMGYWDAAGGGWAVVNAPGVQSPEEMAAVILHEFGHALSLHVLPKPHREPIFRRAWSTGRRRVKERWPESIGARIGIGGFCGPWAFAVQEVWAEAFAWIYGARSTTHSAFGGVFRECVALVQADLDALPEPV